MGWIARCNSLSCYFRWGRDIKWRPWFLWGLSYRDVKEPPLMALVKKITIGVSTVCRRDTSATDMASGWTVNSCVNEWTSSVRAPFFGSNCSYTCIHSRTKVWSVYICAYKYLGRILAWSIIPFVYKSFWVLSFYFPKNIVEWSRQEDSPFVAPRMEHTRSLLTHGTRARVLRTGVLR